MLQKDAYAVLHPWAPGMTGDTCSWKSV